MDVSKRMSSSQAAKYITELRGFLVKPYTVRKHAAALGLGVIVGQVRFFTLTEVKRIADLCQSGPGSRNPDKAKLSEAGKKGMANRWGNREKKS